MTPRSYKLNLPTNPFLQVVYFIAGGVLLIGALLMSAFILAIAFGLAIVFGVVVFVRVWWLKRKLARAGMHGGGAGGTAGGAASGGRASGDLLEVEYTVVDERDERDERDEQDGGGDHDPVAGPGADARADASRERGNP